MPFNPSRNPFPSFPPDVITCLLPRFCLTKNEKKGANLLSVRFLFGPPTTRVDKGLRDGSPQKTPGRDNAQHDRSGHVYVATRVANSVSDQK